MAKKKVSQIPQEQKEGAEAAAAAAMETQLMEEKVANLKSLNALLVKETCERREQIEAMAKEKERAEAEAAKAEVERSVAMVFVAEEVERLKTRVLKAEEENGRDIEGLRRNVGDLEKANAEADGAVRRAREEELRLKEEMNDIEKEKRERGFEIGELRKAVGLLNADLDRERKGFEGVSCERDEIRKLVDVQMEELRGLRARLYEQEQRNVVVEEEVGRVQAEMGGLVEERKEWERVFESLRAEKMSLERKLVESLSSIEGLRREIVEVEREKEEIEAEKAKQVVGIAELQKEVVQLRAAISALKEEEKGFRSEVFKLRKSNAEALEKQEILLLDFVKLVEEKREAEGKLKLLLDEKDSIERSLEAALLQLEEHKRREDGIVREKAEIEQKSATQEFELLELRKEISCLEDSVSALKDICKSHAETNKQLLCEAKDYLDKLTNLQLEREATQKELDLKRSEELTLRRRVVELKKSVHERERDLTQLRKERSNLFEETKGTKSRIETLMEEKRLLERSLLETEEDFKNLRSKMKSYELYAEKISELLSNATKVICSSEEAVEDGKVGSVVNADDIEEGLNLVGAELDAIKKTFKSKDEKVEELMKELEVVKNSLKEANQKKSFWTLMSSATTIVAAASLAYVSRVR
ncbi:hypothetical protein Scep_009182 [Stephania cephalantha]|uniref:Uncharacterized protein n=1 Tax=Stephania cephalantha TaxID=152367 RepID=A0AAP0JT67_9MAGN